LWDLSHALLKRSASTDAPAASPIIVGDTSVIGTVLTGNPQITDTEGDDTSVSTYRWLIDDDTGVMDAAMVFHDDDKTLHVHRVEVFATPIGSDIILNIRDVDGTFARSGEGTYLFTRYRFEDDDTLHMWYLRGYAAASVIEDGTQALGASIGGRKVGSFGDVSLFSFYATKMLTTGEGGMVLSKNTRLLKKMRDMRDYDHKKNYVVRFNYKMTDFQAALGIEQLAKLSSFITKREAIARRYTKELSRFNVDTSLVSTEKKSV